VVCEIGTLLIRSTLEIIQYSPKHNASVGYPTLALPLVRASIATHETDLTLKRFRHFKEGPEVGPNQQESSAYVRCPADHQNWHVILLQQKKLMGPRAAVPGVS
jgi:hypothetical protein